jgi:hypothetical protein
MYNSHEYVGHSPVAIVVLALRIILWDVPTSPPRGDGCLGAEACGKVDVTTGTCSLGDECLIVAARTPTFVLLRHDV